MIKTVGTPELVEYLQSQPAEAVPFLGLSGALQLTSGRWLYYGGAINNLTTTAGGVHVFDGLADTNKFIGQITAGASAAAQSTGPTYGVICEAGIYIQATGGTFNGSIWAVPLDFRMVEEWLDHKRELAGGMRRGA